MPNLKQPYKGKGIAGKPGIKPRAMRPCPAARKEWKPSERYRELDQAAYAPSPMGEVRARMGKAKNIKEAIYLDMQATGSPIKTLNNLKHYMMFEGDLGFNERAKEKKPSAQLELELDLFQKTKLGEDLGQEYERLAKMLNPENRQDTRKAVLIQAIETLKARIAEDLLREKKARA